jgi:3',5'-cyclic AMP phosphodiesterase CpdA
MSTLLQLSDLHLNGPRQTRYGIDADRALRLVLGACTQLHDLTAVLVTGDIADDGSTAAYRRARDAVLEFTAERGIPAMFTVGNHDDRDAFREVFGSGHLDCAGNDCSSGIGPGERICAATITNGLRLVTLDSLVPGRWYGELGQAQLDWLDSNLTQQPNIPTVVACTTHPSASTSTSNVAFGCATTTS